jgi:chromosome segregation ATPase
MDRRLRKLESDLAGREEKARMREKQLAFDAEKYSRLKEMESELLEAQAEATRIREGLVRERHQMQKSAEAERQRLKESQQLALKRLEDERRDLAQKNQRMEQMQSALENSREDLGRMHRETLEIRLATEELWLRLSGAAPTEHLKESLGKIRARLGDQYRDAIAKLEQQKEDLKALREQLMEQHEKLMVRREELDRWVERCERAVHQRESQVKSKEAELDRRESTIDEMVRRCREEHKQAQLEIEFIRSQAKNGNLVLNESEE